MLLSYTPCPKGEKKRGWGVEQKQSTVMERKHEIKDITQFPQREIKLKKKKKKVTLTDLNILPGNERKKQCVISKNKSNKQ